MMDARTVTMTEDKREIERLKIELSAWKKSADELIELLGPGMDDPDEDCLVQAARRLDPDYKEDCDDDE